MGLKLIFIKMLLSDYKILVCAYSCVRDPDQRFGDGGEGSLGESMVFQLSRIGKLWVLTHYKNRQAIGKKFSERDDIHFIYVALPRLFNFLENRHGGIQIYAYLWQVKAYFVARKLHKKIKFDAFHHVTYANDWMASFIGALLPIPYIRGPGGGAHRIPQPFLVDYSFKEKFWEKLRSLGQWAFRHDPFFTIGQNRAKAILVCNQEAFNALSQGWRKKAVFFPVNGISKEDIQLSTRPGLVDAREWNNEKFTVISAGKLLKLKNFNLAIKAFLLFRKSCPDSVLKIIGDGPERENLRQIVKKSEAEKDVLFSGWVGRNELLKKIAESDLFLFASLRDGGGQVVVEAMAQGKPVVCFDISGPGFHIKDEWGIKIKPVNPEQAVSDVARALGLLCRDKNLRETMGKAAKKRAEEFYLWDNLGDRIREMYQRFL